MKTTIMTKMNDTRGDTQSRDDVLTIKEDCHRREIGMSRTKRILMGLFLGVSVMFLHHEASAGPRMLNVIFRLDMVNSGVDQDASGAFSGMLMRNGITSNQQLKLSVAHLDASTDYQLFAFIGDDANPRIVAVFTTDANGAFAVTYVQRCPGNSSRGGQPLPNVLDPISYIHQLDIV